MSDAPLPGPVLESERIRSMDVARGLALLGIFLVNINLFAEPLGAFMATRPDAARGTVEHFWWLIDKVFWEGRFYTLFSMLFGMGLVIQWRRAQAAGRSFIAPTLRRLFFLTGIGFLHAMLLWFGDILFLYGLMGLIAMTLVKRRRGTLLIVAASLIGFVIAVTLAVGVLTMIAERMKPASDQSAAQLSDESDEASSGATVKLQTKTSDQASTVQKEGPFWRLIEGFENRTITDPASPGYMELELEAYRDGPWLHSFLFRAMSWASMISFTMIGFGWHVLAMFCLGAALFKSDIFSPSRRRWHIGFIVAAIVAVPLAAAATLYQEHAPGSFIYLVPTPLMFILGPVISLGYLGMVTLIVNAGALAAVTRTVAAVGRMAFTNYLMQSVVATAIFYHWGLGYFGSTTRGERVLIVLAVYTCQLALSVLWLRWFTMGPLEWFWRGVTYLRFSPLRRRHQ